MMYYQLEETEQTAKYLKQAKAIQTKAAEDMRALWDKLLDELVLEFRRRYPKRRLRILSGHGQMVVTIDEMDYDYSYRKLDELYGRTVSCFDFIAQTLTLIEWMSDGDPIHLNRDIDSKPEAKQQREAA